MIKISYSNLFICFLHKKLFCCFYPRDVFLRAKMKISPRSRKIERGAHEGANFGAVKRHYGGVRKSNMVSVIQRFTSDVRVSG